MSVEIFHLFHQVEGRAVVQGNVAENKAGFEFCNPFNGLRDLGDGCFDLYLGAVVVQQGMEQSGIFRIIVGNDSGPVGLCHVFWI